MVIANGKATPVPLCLRYCNVVLYSFCGNSKSVEFSVKVWNFSTLLPKQQNCKKR